MKAILGTKVGMTQLWDDKGRLVGVTLIKTEPNKVISKTSSQITLGTTSNGKTRKPQQKIAEILGSKKGIWQKTFRNFELESDEITVEAFKPGQIVSVSGVTKGKGFAGVVKRYGFAGWPASHGHSHQRRPGSIGAQQPQHVLKGKKMAGHMGNANLTVRGNKVVAVDVTEGLIILSGAVPGPRSGRVIVRSLS